MTKNKGWIRKLLLFIYNCKRENIKDILGPILLFFMIRSQTLIGNEQLLRSMTPHHSEAILVCQQSSITDPEIIVLCEEIVQTQKEEIAQMNAILERYR